MKTAPSTVARTATWLGLVTLILTGLLLAAIYISPQIVLAYLGLTLAVIAATAIYFIPYFIARKTAKPSTIFYANLLFAWTIIGWAVVLVWAIHSRESCPLNPTPPRHP